MVRIEMERADAERLRGMLTEWQGDLRMELAQGAGAVGPRALADKALVDGLLRQLEAVLAHAPPIHLEERV